MRVLVLVLVFVFARLSPKIRVLRNSPGRSVWEGVWDTEVRPGAQCSQGQALSSTEIAKLTNDLGRVT